MKNTVLRTTVVAWLCVQAVYCQENSCTVNYTKEGCTERVICNFKDIVIREKRQFIISVREESVKEIIADCNWVRSGKFDCDPTTGYTCDPQLSVIFSVNITKPEKCIKSGEFFFDVALEKPFSCKIAPPEQVIPEEKMNSNNATANTNHESPNKCRNSTDENENESNRTKRSTNENENRCQEGASEQKTTTGMIIGVVFLCLLAGVGVLLLVKWKTLVAFVRERKGHEGLCVKAPDRSILETADSPIADPLEEKDDVLEALPFSPGINPELNINIINMNPTEHDKACDVRLLHGASSYDVDDNECVSSSKQTLIVA